MKKTVLTLLLALGIWLYSDAQQVHSKQKQPSRSAPHTKPMLLSQVKKKSVNKNDAPSFYKQSATEKSIVASKKPVKRTQSADGAPCGSAFNLYGLLTAATTAVTADQNLGAIVFTHRIDNTKISAYGSGTYEASISLNMGANWDTSKLIYNFPAGSASGTRYPNGVIFNPSGNTTFTNAYWSVNGPYTTGTASGIYDGWDSIAFGSMKFDSTFITEKYKGNGKPGVLIEEGTEYTSVTDDSTVHSVGSGDVFNAALTGDSWSGVSVNTGKFNSTNHNFDWTQTLIRPHLMSDGGYTTFDTLAQVIGETGMAWSQDGKTGYVVIFGNLDSSDGSGSLNFASYQPIVYKTTNSGATWAMMPMHNWDNDTTFVQYLPQAQDSAVVAPFFGQAYTEQGGDDDYDLVVDANNNLHIFTGVHGSAIAAVEGSDSLGWYYQGFVFDLHTTTPTGGWVARYVDSLSAAPTQVINDGVWVNTTALAMGHRIQATRTDDGSHIFVTWLDDYVSYVGPTTIDSMQYPDMFGQGFDVTTGVASPIKSFTYNLGLPQSSQEYYICVSDKPLITGSIGSQTYQIPVVRVAPPTGSGNDGTMPVSFLYDATNVYTDADFIPAGIEPITQTTSFSITPNYPNPFNGITRFGINLTKDGLVNIDVYNMVGQKMMSMDPQELSPGSHTIVINGNGFAPGVYFYRVTVDGTSLTQKMVIE
ncbi:MAG TPA: T9SS type A sorting domain-containing protein [Bacteroidia bacterium]|nr:T9SS type A sorting domain-containing protein [Bacteroidia bacterium]